MPDRTTDNLKRRIPDDIPLSGEARSRVPRKYRQGMAAAFSARVAPAWSPSQSDSRQATTGAPNSRCSSRSGSRHQNACGPPPSSNAFADAFRVPIAVGVNVMPILPGLTDREADLDRLFQAAREAGAQWIAANVVFLMPTSWRSMLTFLDQRFPKLARQYREWFSGYGDAPEAYREQISQRVAELRRKYGLRSRPQNLETARSWHSPQLQLDLGDGEKPCPARDRVVGNLSPEGLLVYKTL